MFRIGEFSQIARVSGRLLRYYDSIGLLRPVRIDPATGYRYYSADQLPRLNSILALKELGLSLDQVHAEADRLEHALSEELEAKIDAELGYPTHDPHGDPIPDRDLRIDTVRSRTLVDLAPGERAEVSRVPDGDPDLLRYLTDLGLVPGSAVEMVGQAPFSGPVTLRTGNGEHAISRELAVRIGAAD